MKYITCLVIGLFMTNTSYAYTDIKKYPKESCQEIYQAIGTFLGLADGEWKEMEKRQCFIQPHQLITQLFIQLYVKSKRRDAQKTECTLKDWSCVPPWGPLASISV